MCHTPRHGPLSEVLLGRAGRCGWARRRTYLPRIYTEERGKSASDHESKQDRRNAWHSSWRVIWHLSVNRVRSRVMELLLPHTAYRWVWRRSGRSLASRRPDVAFLAL